MSRGSFAIATIVGALTLAGPAIADQAKSVTATGSSEVKVSPKNRKSNPSIRAAVDAARKAGIGDALDQAHEYASDYARAAGLTLGAIVSVSDAQTGPGYYGPGPFIVGPFGPNQYCGTVRRPIFKVVGGKRKVVRVRRVHRCFVPPFEVTTLTVTYSAT